MMAGIKFHVREISFVPDKRHYQVGSNAEHFNIFQK